MWLMLMRLMKDEMSMKRMVTESERQYPSVGDGDGDSVVRHEVRRR